MRFQYLFLLMGLFLSPACENDIEENPREPTCTTTIESTFPANGATDFYYRDTIEFRLSDPDPTAKVLTQIEGEQFTSDDGKTILFVPSQGLGPLTTYEIGLDYCHGKPTISFTTSELGGAIASLAEVEGNTYVFNLAHARYTQGGQAAKALLAIFNKDVLIQIREATDTTISMRGAVGETIDGIVEQDICYRTIDLADFGVESADFSYEESELTIDFYETELSFLDLWISGTFAPDGSWIGGVALVAKVDVRGLTETMGLGEPDEVCTFAEGLGAPCEPCSNDGESYCISISVEKISATAVDVDLQKIEENDSFEECLPDEEPI
jgi:hypothetical protein